MSVGNCPNESAIQKQPVLSSSKAVARFVEVGVPTSITKKAVLEVKDGVSNPKLLMNVTTRSLFIFLDASLVLVPFQLWLNASTLLRSAT